MKQSILALRRRGQAARRELDAHHASIFSEEICRRFLRSHLFLAADRLAVYLPMANEVDTSLVLQRAWKAGKAVFVPVLEDRQRMRFVRIERNTYLRRNIFGTWEPVSGEVILPRNLDVVVTPVVAFDENRNRIGMGGGYYDRCFSFLGNKRQWQHPKLAGFAFDCQNVEKIRPNHWDIPLYGVFTETS